MTHTHEPSAPETVTRPNLELIDPKRHDRYSPNLYKWLKQRGAYRRLESLVYRRTDACFESRRVLIGRFDEDNHFSGAVLNHVLCYGTKSETGWYGLFPALELIPNFWSEYERIGRCAIDPEHNQSWYRGVERWHTEGDTRSCLWCGNCVQHLERWEETVKCSAWRNVTALGATEGTR